MKKKPDKAQVRKRSVADRLVELGLADSLVKAQALVLAGKVVVADQRVDKPSQMVPDDAPVRVKEGGKYVSRGGDKLAKAVTDLSLAARFKGAVVLDVGASTGGFTHCALDLGAIKVISVDVGTNQLAWELRQDPRVVVLEKTDIRNFEPASHPGVDIVVADISFNGLARLAPALKAAAPRAGTDFVLLIKPQFELPRDKIPAGGVVEDDVLRTAAVASVIEALTSLGMSVVATVDCQVAGRSGNREVFVHARG